MEAKNESKIVSKELVITRTFDAPIELVFNAFAKPEHLTQWWGPKGFRTIAKKHEFKPGGVFHYAMKSGDTVMWGKFVFEEIIANEKISFINSFSNEAEEITRAPFSEAWPLQMKNTITFVENGSKTTITLRVKPIEATDEETRVFEDGFASMDEGYNGTFDQLEDLIKRLKR